MVTPNIFITYRGIIMSSLKDMYHTVVEEHFPPTISISFGNKTLTYTKKIWNINGQVKGLRYGDNPDQPAALYEFTSGELTIGGVSWRTGGGIISALTEAELIQSGKHPGKTNITDIDNGCNILQYLASRPAAVILKHNNPCGVAWSKEGISDALEKAFWCDRIAAFGGAVIVNHPLDYNSAKLISNHYFEVIAAPDYELGVLELLTTKKNLRILKLPGLASLDQLTHSHYLDIKSLCDGGLILQESFLNHVRSATSFLPATATSKDGAVISAQQPTLEQAEDLLFAWAIEAGVSSNSVIFAHNGATVAIGTGEQDRVGCIEIAIFKAYAKYADKLTYQRYGLSLYELREQAANNEQALAYLEKIKKETSEACGGLKGSVMVSDGFFPFRDGIDLCINQGIKAIAQPGGSLNDYEIIKAVNDASPPVAMFFTGQRSFKH